MLAITKGSDLPRGQFTRFMGDDFFAAGRALVQHHYREFNPSSLERVSVITPDDLLCTMSMSYNGSIKKIHIKRRPGEYEKRQSLFGTLGVTIPGLRPVYLQLELNS